MMRGGLHVALTTKRQVRRPSLVIVAVGPESLTVSFVLPTHDADGSAIGVIDNTTIYYDTVSREGTGVAYAYSTSVGDGTSTSKVVTGLQSATTYYFATTVTVGGVESNLSTETSATTA
jgi:hypothetical protein